MVAGRGSRGGGGGGERTATGRGWVTGLPLKILEERDGMAVDEPFSPGAVAAAATSMRTAIPVSR